MQTHTDTHAHRRREGSGFITDSLAKANMLSVFQSVIHKDPICSQKAYHDSVFIINMTANTVSVHFGYIVVHYTIKAMISEHVKAVNSFNKSSST